MPTLTVEPGEMAKAPVKYDFDGELLTEMELEGDPGNETNFKFYDYGDGFVLNYCQFVKDGEELGSYAPYSPRNIEDIERSLINVGAIDGELPGEVKEALREVGIT